MDSDGRVKFLGGVGKVKGTRIGRDKVVKGGMRKRGGDVKQAWQSNSALQVVEEDFEWYYNGIEEAQQWGISRDEVQLLIRKGVMVIL